MRTGGYQAALVLLVVLLSAANALRGQSSLPVDSASGQVVYRFEIKAAHTQSKKMLYTLSETWLSEQVEKFSRSNDTGNYVPAIPDKKQNENKAAVLKVFANPYPLQHTDPESDRLSGRVILKYTGKSGGCIRLFYVQYAVVIVAEEEKLNIEFCNFRYNHFNPRSYQTQPVFNWSGMMPCDEINTLEYLKDCEQCHAEFADFYNFLNRDVESLFTSLRNEVLKKGETALEQN